MWYLEKFNIKNWENVRIIQCLINDQELLQNIHFVRDASHCPRYLLITKHCSKEPTFYYYKYGMTVKSKEKMFHDIRLHKDKALYIQLLFHKSYQSSHYVSVIETNPYEPSRAPLTEEENGLVEQLFQTSYYNYNRGKLKKELDVALDEKDEMKFKLLSNKLHLLEQMHPKKQTLHK